jgi:hypothetical protein
LALAEVFKSQGIRLPDELVLISPWVDVVMDNEEIKEYASRDPFLAVSSLRVSAKHWMDDLDGHDPKVSPIYGDLKGIRNVTVFVGTGESFYPDVTKFYSMLDPDPPNELIVAEDEPRLSAVSDPGGKACGGEDYSGGKEVSRLSLHDIQFLFLWITRVRAGIIRQSVDVVHARVI